MISQNPNNNEPNDDAPKQGVGGGLLSDPVHLRGDLRMIERAVRKGWGLSDETRDYIQSRIDNIIRNPNDQVFMNMFALILTADRINATRERTDSTQKIEHTITALTPEQRKQHIDAILAERGSDE